MGARELTPRVLRARGFRLYVEGGGRLVDLWQTGGAAILGHNPPAVTRELKNTADRGLFAGFPHPLERRFLKALSMLLPGRRFRVYADGASLGRALAGAGLAASAGAGGDASGPAWFDPALAAPCSGAAPCAEAAPVSLWRPFLDAPQSPVLVPVLPWPLSPKVLAIGEPGEAGWNGGMASAGQGLLERSKRILDGRISTESRISAEPRISTEPGAASRICGLLPPSDTVSPVILAAATRAIYDLVASPQRGAVRFGRVEAALEKADGYWRRQGIYLSCDLTEGLSGTGDSAPAAAQDTASAATYAGLFGRFLEAGFLLPPSADQPVILPAVLSEGEEASLAKLLAFKRI